jgi:hypothetical protein
LISIQTIIFVHFDALVFTQLYSVPISL